jgi:hypothetical protein
MRALVVSGGGSVMIYTLSDPRTNEINVTYSAIRNVIINKKFKCKGFLWKIKQ